MSLICHRHQSVHSVRTVPYPQTVCNVGTRDVVAFMTPDVGQVSSSDKNVNVYIRGNNTYALFFFLHVVLDLRKGR